MFSGTPTLPFPREEHLARQAKLRAALVEQGFDAILVFAQESHYWLTGYDTGGSVFFQAAVFAADASPITLLTRRRTCCRRGKPAWSRTSGCGGTPRTPTRPAS